MLTYAKHKCTAENTVHQVTHFLNYRVAIQLLYSFTFNHPIMQTVKVPHVGTFATKSKVAEIKKQLQKQEQLKAAKVHRTKGSIVYFC